MKKITKASFKRGVDKNYNTNLISSVDEYLKHIEFIQDHWFQTKLWFRGVDKSKYKLYPSIYRDTLWKYNKIEAQNLTNDFIHKAKGYSERVVKKTKWEWYQIMQHHGCPTRLLDWTEGSLIALYFAVRNLNCVYYPCVWILNPFDLNHSSVDTKAIFFTDPTTMDEGDSIVNKYLDDSELPKFPIAIVPSYSNKRMTAQRSCFTVHGKYKTGFSKLHNYFETFDVVQLKIKTQSAATIRNQILQAGISEATLFQDLDGLAREMKANYNMKN